MKKSGKSGYKRGERGRDVNLKVFCITPETTALHHQETSIYEIDIESDFEVLINGDAGGPRVALKGSPRVQLEDSMKEKENSFLKSYYPTVEESNSLIRKGKVETVEMSTGPESVESIEKPIKMADKENQAPSLHEISGEMKEIVKNYIIKSFVGEKTPNLKTILECWSQLEKNEVHFHHHEHHHHHHYHVTDEDNPSNEETENRMEKGVGSEDTTRTYSFRTYQTETRFLNSVPRISELLSQKKSDFLQSHTFSDTNLMKCDEDLKDVSPFQIELQEFDSNNFESDYKEDEKDSKNNGNDLQLNSTESENNLNDLKMNARGTESISKDFNVNSKNSEKGTTDSKTSSKVTEVNSKDFEKNLNNSKTSSKITEVNSKDFEKNLNNSKTSSKVMEVNSNDFEKNSNNSKPSLKIIEMNSRNSEKGSKTNSKVMEVNSKDLEKDSNTSKTSSKVTEVNSKDFEKNSNNSKPSSKVIEMNSKNSEKLSKDSKTNSKLIEINSKDCEPSAKDSKTSSKVNCIISTNSEKDSKELKTNSKDLEKDSNTSKTSSKVTEVNSKDFEKNSNNSKPSSKVIEMNSKNSEKLSKDSKTNSKLIEINSKDCEPSAKDSKTSSKVNCIISTNSEKDSKELKTNSKDLEKDPNDSKTNSKLNTIQSKDFKMNSKNLEAFRVSEDCLKGFPMDLKDFDVNSMEISFTNFDAESKISDCSTMMQTLKKINNFKSPVVITRRESVPKFSYVTCECTTAETSASSSEAVHDDEDVSQKKMDNPPSPAPLKLWETEELISELKEIKKKLRRIEKKRWKEKRNSFVPLDCNKISTESKSTYRITVYSSRTFIITPESLFKMKSDRYEDSKNNSGYLLEKERVLFDEG